MSLNSPPSELGTAFAGLRTYYKQAAGLSFFASLLTLAPAGYMLEVYDRVVNSRSHTTLVMLTLLVLGAYVLLEVLEWARSGVLQEAGLVLDRLLRGRVFGAILTPI